MMSRNTNLEFPQFESIPAGIWRAYAWKSGLSGRCCDGGDGVCVSKPTAEELFSEHLFLPRILLISPADTK